ncbi:MAG: hypothetical protein FWF59_03440 [Turicibacter sp.]|nr:hypothetical protein [Turicibacter sp.]
MNHEKIWELIQEVKNGKLNLEELEQIVSPATFKQLAYAFDVLVNPRRLEYW